LVSVTVQDDAGTANGGLNSVNRTFRVTVVDLPLLSITRQDDVVVLSWPTSASDFQLERLDDLSNPADWTPVLTPPTVVGDQNVVTDNLVPSYRFFRLHRP
jgi:hypothetical protein